MNEEETAENKSAWRKLLDKVFVFLLGQVKEQLSIAKQVGKKFFWFGFCIGAGVGVGLGALVTYLIATW